MASGDVSSSDTSQVIVSTKIEAVTVFTDRALVTRRGGAILSPQVKELLVTNLPLSLQPESIRASGMGTNVVKLRGVETAKVITTAPTEERIAQITRQIQQLESQRQELQDQITALTMQRDFVKNLGDVSVSRFASSLARHQVSLEQTKELMNFIGQQYGEYALAIAEGQKEAIEQDKQLQALHEQLSQLHRPRFDSYYNLKVDLECAEAGNFELEISYIVNHASWTPLYDLRLEGDRVTLNYLAEVQQNTGEDWLGVKLILSTAKPGLGTLPPKLHPWYIDVWQPMAPPIAPAASAARGMRTDIGGMDTVIMAAAPEAPLMAAQTASAEVKASGGVITFELSGNNNIPSDGNPHKTTILNSDFNCQLNYVAIPKLVSFAYLKATITNPKTGATLLPGQANIFRNNRFVGTTELENILPGQEFDLNLGIDESIKIERDLVERDVEKRFISGQRRTTYAYRIKLSNFSDRPANLVLSEQLPLSRNEKVKVQLFKVSPPISLGEVNLLQWQFNLAPQGQQEVYYQFTVEHPPEFSITGLDI